MAEPLRSQSDRDRRTAFLAERFTKDYPAFQYVFVEFLVEHLTDLSRTFGGDLQQMLLLALIGQRRLRAIRACSGHGDGVAASQMSITASRLADVTGIPRETVRRKLALLRDRGWIEQAADGSWSILASADGLDVPARRDLAEQDLGVRRRVARLVAALEDLADRHGG